MPLAPPPERIYPDFEIAEEAIKSWARNEGYGVFRGRSKKDKHKAGVTRRKVWILCDKSRESRAEAGTRRSASRKTDCPFKLTITRSIDTGLWDVEVENGEHNHPASSNPSQHPCHRKLTDEEKSLIESLTRSHVPPKNILLNLLQQNPDTAVVSQDIRNERKRLRKERLSGKGPAEALLDMMEDSGYYGYCVEKDPGSNRMTKLFFAHFKGIELAQAFPEVLLINCTYRTNIYNMPLLHFTGVTPTGKNFSISFALLSAENTFQYAWVLAAFKATVLGDNTTPEVIITDNEDALLNALQEVYTQMPHLLCRWHVEKNVLKKASEQWRVKQVSDDERAANQKLLDTFMQRWTEVVLANSKDEFEELYSRLKVDYAGQEGLIKYLDAYKYPQKHLFAKAWTDDTLHFRVMVTSRIKGGHSTLKRFLNDSKNDLFGVIDACSDLHVVQY